MGDKHFTLHTNLYTFKNVFDVGTLENYLQWTTRDIERHKEVIEETLKYQESVRDHISWVASIATVPEVNLQRSVTYKGKVEYFVSVKHVPQVEFDDSRLRMYIKSTENERFEGKQRHVALAYAEELAKKYNCEIKKVGFKK